MGRQQNIDKIELQHADRMHYATIMPDVIGRLRAPAIKALGCQRNSPCLGV
jgi:hypothetical protein